MREIQLLKQLEISYTFIKEEFCEPYQALNCLVIKVPYLTYLPR